MPYDSHRHGRRSIRLRGYDYTQPGWYFVTICTHGRQPLFGTIANDVIQQHDAGRMVEQWWHTLDDKYPTVTTDAWIVMPDHVHGIIVIGATEANAVTNAVGADSYICPQRYFTDYNEDNANDEGGYANPPLRNDIDDTNVVSLSTIVQWFKIMTTTNYIRQVKHAGWLPFERRVWQRGFYERIIRDDRELDNVRRYIIEHPARHAARLDALLMRMHHRESE